MKRLPDKWVEKIFQRLTGIYGAQFRSKFSQVNAEGVDVGLAMAMDAWADELGTFADWPEAISYALSYLPTDHAPNALEFRDICKRAPDRAEQVARVEYKPTAEDVQRARAAAESAARAVKPKIQDGIDRHWATHPRSVLQLKMIFEAAANDPRFKPCIAEMVEQGICTEDGRLLKVYRHGEWYRAGGVAA